MKFRINSRTKIQGNPDKTMKNLIFAFLLVPSFLFAQASPAIDAISTALGSGDVETVSKYFADNVEISVNEREQNYPKARAAVDNFAQQIRLIKTSNGTTHTCIWRRRVRK